MKRIVAFAALAFAVSAFAQQPPVPPAPPAQAPAPARQLIADAQKAAAKDGRKVMVIFHASWCGWCHKFEGFMDQPQFKPLFAKSYAIVRLDVLENDDKKNLENPGGMDVMNELGGANQGIPYFAVLDGKGKAIVNSKRPSDRVKGGENIGHPAAPEEIAHFMSVLKTTSKMNADELAKIEAWLKNQK